VIGSRRVVGVTCAVDVIAMVVVTANALVLASRVVDGVVITVIDAAGGMVGSGEAVNTSLPQDNLSCSQQ